VGDAHDRRTRRRQFFQGGQHGPHISIAEAIDLAHTQIGRDRVDQDQNDVADVGNLLAQLFQIVDQAEGSSALLPALIVAVVHHLDDLDAIEIGAGGGEPRHHGVFWVILRGEQQHIAERRTPFIIRPWQIGAGAACGNVCDQLPLTLIGQPGDDSDFAEGKAFRPQPVERLHFNG
jgi:hypothetical protein